MTSRPHDTARAPATSSALAAFLRGMERRALVFGWLLSGSREAGTRALAWTLERFRLEAARTPFGDWPRRFWSLLLAAPGLRRPLARPDWGEDFDWLSRIGHGPRAALLLRLVAGLAESDAAAVLGTGRPTYRLGLQRALPRGSDGRADVQAWEALGHSAQTLMRELPPSLQRVAAPPLQALPARPGSRRPPGRGVRVALWLVALLTTLALAATFLAFDRLPPGLGEAPNAILSEALPAAEPPAGRYADEDALQLHPDLGLLLDAGKADAAAADPAFHAWLQAEGRAAPEAASEAAAADTVAAADDVLPDPAVADAAAIAAAAQADAAAAAQSPRQRLAALDLAERRQLAQRRDAWDALPPADRGARRERWSAWRELPAGERAALRASALRFAALDPERQAALRARFDALDASVRHGWLLGPGLGADYPRLHALVAQVPAEARAAVLEALRGLDAQARDDLAVLAARTPPQERAELRVELLATPSAQRGRWLRNRVTPPFPQD